MPRVRTPEIPFVKMQRLLLGYGYNGPALARILDCDPKTARDRLKHPEKLTLKALDLISRRGHIPMEDLRVAIQK